MTQEEKELLLIDLCARVYYGVLFMVHDDKIKEPVKLLSINPKRDKPLEIDDGYDENSSTYWNPEDVTPYLRPMSSMTEEEKKELKQLSDEYLEEWTNAQTPIDKWKLDGKISYNRSVFYNSHHLDWNGLIEKGLALEAPKDMYNNKTE